jgi:hypothetical protein
MKAGEDPNTPLGVRLTLGYVLENLGNDPDQSSTELEAKPVLKKIFRMTI